MEDVQAFIDTPSRDFLETYTREQLPLTADNFSVFVQGDKHVKENVQSGVISQLSAVGVFGEEGGKGSSAASSYAVPATGAYI